MASPVFNTTAYNVNENVFATGITTVQVDVTDADPLDTLVFSITGAAADNSKFLIDTVSGELHFNVSPDFENPDDVDADGTYEVEVSVFDGTNTTVQTITITVDNVTPAPIDGTSGDDIIDSTNGATVENDTLNGLGGNDTLDGGLGDDTLDGGLGADHMIGGDGSDTYVVDDAGDNVDETGESGSDTVMSSINFTLGGQIENLTLTGSAINGTGNSLDNTITGNSAANKIDGGAGADSMIGGNGADTYTVDNVGDTITEGTGVASGVDIVNATVTYTLSNNVEKLNLLGSSAINGTGNALGNTITGNSAINTLTGMDGNDTLNGGIGADILIGGNGSDKYIVDNAGDTITEGTDVGLDSVDASVTYTLSDNVENLTLTGSAAINGTGNGGNNNLTGNSGVNTLTGGSGRDTLNGGLGADILVGGLGNDTYIIDATDTVTEASGGGTGTDLVKAGITYSIAALVNIENIELTGLGNINATGNAGDNLLTGNLGTNILTGGAGNDIYTINKTADTVVELSGGGHDTVNATGPAGSTFTMASFVEDMHLGGIVATNAIGNTLDNVISGNAVNNNISGGDGNDTLTGDAGVDTLNGGEGNDSLDGGFGVDAMTGGNGNDTYFINEVADSVVEGSGGTSGTDTIVSTLANYTLIADIENLTMGGGNAINGTGNSGDNVITGNKGINTLLGAGGNDTINASGGADFINGGAGIDTMNGGAGLDKFLFSTASDANGDSIVNFTSGETINLSAIDWDTVTGGDQSFTVDANDIFVAGEMDLVVSGSTVTVNLYTDNNAGVDSSFTITLASGVTAAEINFLL